MTDELKKLLAGAAERWRTMTKEEKQAQLLAQRLSLHFSGSPSDERHG
jgi:hypothetical protein